MLITAHWVINYSVLLTMERERVAEMSALENIVPLRTQRMIEKVSNGTTIKVKLLLTQTKLCFLQYALRLGRASATLCEPYFLV